jgi:tetratricopeptide (TPR) repeat protein
MIALFFALLMQPDPEALSSQAQQFATQKRFDEAESLWRQAIGIAPGYFPAFFNLGYMKTTLADWSAAQPLLERAAAIEPNDFNTRFLLGQTLLRLDRRDDALRQWRVALTIQPKNLRLMQLMTVEYENGGYFGESQAVATRALQLNPEDSNLYFLAIHACQVARDLDAGLAIARRAAAKFPDSARANFELGFHLERSGDRANAMTYLERAMKLDPRFEEPFFYYGDLLVSDGKDEEALPYLRKAIEIRPGFAFAHLAVAKANMHLERWPAAIEALNEAIRIDARNPEPHLLLSRIHFRLGDEELAKKEKETSLRLRRENPNAMEAVQGRPFPK